MTASRPALRRALAPAWRRRNAALPLLLAAAITASASGVSLIKVHSGDTLSAIAARYHTTVARLVALNSLPGDGDIIYAGQQIEVPGTPHVVRSHTTTITHYVVRAGDSLDRIAARFHVTPHAIARRNSIPRSLMVRIGQRLRISRTVTTTHPHVAPAISHVSHAGTASAVQDRLLLARRAEPSRADIASLIRATSARFGLDPHLALAISWQESGWDMRRVSGVDAIGAMQVMPGTATYLSQNVLHRSLNLSDAKDNVTAGVALLSILMHETSSSSMSAAGYYQGLASVRAHGMLPSTKQYVADVTALRSRL